MDRQLGLDSPGRTVSHSPPATPDSFSRPRPRPQRSPSQAARIRVQNRRREYLARNPASLESAEQEFADPDLYDRLVRQFQSRAEREADSRSKGWGRALESSLRRGEARLERAAAASAARGAQPTSASPVARTPGAGTAALGFAAAGLVEDDDKPASKEEGRAAWDDYLRERFVRGGVDDFDYGVVDENDELDSLEHMDLEEAYFDEEEPEWAEDSDAEGMDTDSAADDGHNAEEQKRPRRERFLVGQTGVQDY